MKVLIVFCALTLAYAKPAIKEDGAMEKLASNLRDCLETDTLLCLKEKTMKYTENLAVAKDFSLVDGISFVRTGSPRSARSYDPLPEDPKARDVAVEDRIADNVVDFLDSHVLQLRMPRSFTEDNSIDEEEGRGKKAKKKLKKLMPIISLLKLKFTALIPLFLGIIAFAVFKAYLLGKIAFMAAALGALKKLLEKKGGGGGGGGWEESHDDHGHGGGGWQSGGGGGGWGRSNNGQDLAYSAHAKQA